MASWETVTTVASRQITDEHRAKLQQNAAKARKAHSRNAAEARRPLVLAILRYLKANPNASTREIVEAVADVNVGPVMLSNLVDQSVIKVSGKVQTGKRGRPMHRFAVAKRGNDRLRRAS